MVNKKFIDNLEYQITGACIEVHKQLGPGLLESTYQKCLKRQLELQDINFVVEKVIALTYEGVILNSELRADFFVENCMVLEIKAVECLLPVHDAQVLTYMKMLKAPKGLLINFNSVNIVKHGKKPFINEFFNILT